MAPRLSVIIPAYNVEKYIAECLSSVLAFGNPEMEVIVVNDGSTDRTGEIVASFRDDRIQVVWRKNGGVSAARNTGLSRAQGEFILPVDADDVPVTENWPPLIEALALNADAVLAYGASRQFGGTRDDFLRTTPLNWEGRAPYAAGIPRILTANFMQVGAAVVRRDAIERAGRWKEDLRVGEDWEMWCRLACVGEFLSCPILVLGYRVHPWSAMGVPVLGGPDPALAAIEAIYSNPLVLQKTGALHRRLKRKAVAWQTYHWSSRLLRSGAIWAGMKAMARSLSKDPSGVLYLCGHPARRLRRIRENRRLLQIVEKAEAAKRCASVLIRKSA